MMGSCRLWMLHLLLTIAYGGGAGGMLSLGFLNFYSKTCQTCDIVVG